MIINIIRAFYNGWLEIAHFSKVHMKIPPRTDFFTRLGLNVVKSTICSVLLVERVEIAAAYVFYHTNTPNGHADAQSFEAALTAYENEGRDDPLITCAAAKIRRAYYKKSSKLILQEGLKSLPSCISKLVHLKELDLSQNHLTTLPAEIGELKNLVSLNCRLNKFTEIPNVVFELKNLKHLDFSRNTLNHVLPKELEQLTSLEVLDLQASNLNIFPPSVAKLTKLKSIDLSYNSIEELTPEIGNLTALRSFDLSHNQIACLPETFTHLASLEHLVLSSNPLHTFPVEISKLEQLKSLKLTKCNLAEIPAAIGNFQKLVVLHLGCNELANLPEQISSLPVIKELRLSSNNFKSLTTLKPIQSLTTLTLDKNRSLTEIPEWMMLVPNVYCFSDTRINWGTVVSRRSQLIVRSALERVTNTVSEKFFKHIAPNLYLVYWFKCYGLSLNTFYKWRKFEADLSKWVNDSSVTGAKIKASAAIRSAMRTHVLDLSNMELSSLPTLVTAFTKTKELYVDGNQLTSLPEGIKNLTLLERIAIDHNRFVEIPDEIMELRNLILLGAKNNLIRAIPSTIEHLRSLVYLNLSANELETLPAGLGHLIELRVLSVSLNPKLRELPLSLGGLQARFLIDCDHSLDDQARNIMAQCKMRDCLQLFSARIKSWHTLAGKRPGGDKINLEGLDILSDAEKVKISVWLAHMSSSSDYEYNQSVLAYRVCCMLKTLTNNSAFKEYFFGQIEGNLDACGDRAAMGFNELYGYWLVTTMSPQTSLSEKLHTLAKYHRTLALRAILAKSIADEQKRTRKAVLESVEIYLYYEMHLTKRLNLLSVAHGMLYDALGKRDWIDEEVLVKHVESSYIASMAESDMIQELARKDAQFAAEWETKDNVFADEQNELYERRQSLGSGEYNQQSLALQLRRKDSFTNCMIVWIRNQL